MSGKPFGKNLVMVAFSRMVSLFSGVAVGLLLPKIFSISDYGYFKIFTLYAVYTALLHFGFVDGLLLRLAGKRYDELDKDRMRTYTRFFLAFEVVISALMIGVGAIILRGEYLFILVMLALNMVFVNMTTYYQFVSQAVERFGEYSAKNIIVSVAKLALVGILFVIYLFCGTEISYRIYLFALNAMDLAMAVWYVAIYRDITFGRGVGLRSVGKDILGIFKTGIVLTVAYQVSHFVLALDRQFVNILFPTDTFAVYSFAYNIITMISTMVSSIAVVLLPMLKNKAKEQVTAHYRTGVKVVSLVTSAAMMCYFPLVPFIEWFLPNYVASLEYIAIVLPTVLFTSGISVIMFTVEKVLDKSHVFFRNSCIILVLGLISNTLAYIFWESAAAISYASVAVMAVWFLLEGVSLGRRIGVYVFREFVYLALVSASFLLTVHFLSNPLFAFLVFAGVFLLLTVLFYLKFLREYIGKIFSKNKAHT